MLLNDATGIAVLAAQHNSACPGPHCIEIFPSWLHRHLDRVKEAFPPSEANAGQGSHARQCVASWGPFRKQLQSRVHVHIRSLPRLKGGFLSSAAVAEQGSHAHQWLPVSTNGFPSSEAIAEKDSRAHQWLPDSWAPQHGRPAGHRLRGPCEGVGPPKDPPAVPAVSAALTVPSSTARLS